MSSSGSGSVIGGGFGFRFSFRFSFGRASVRAHFPRLEIAPEIGRCFAGSAPSWHDNVRRLAFPARDAIFPVADHAWCVVHHLVDVVVSPRVGR